MENRQLEVMSTPVQHSKKLIECLVKLETPELKSDAKMELVIISGGLMPGGKPNFLDVIRYPKITDLVENYGRKSMLKAVFLLVKDFSNSVNVVRNMNEDQMIEVASMLLDECDNFRLEDYVMMFSMAKRGDLVKIYDRLDISVVTEILDEYWLRRKRAAEALRELEYKHLDSLGSPKKESEFMNSQDLKLIDSISGLTEAFDAMRQGLTNNGFKPAENGLPTIESKE